MKEAIGSIKGQIEGLDYSNTRNADDAINEFFAEKFTALFTKLFPKPSDDDSKYRKELIIKSKIKQVIFNNTHIYILKRYVFFDNNLILMLSLSLSR